MRNTICAALTTITLSLCVALAGCGSASEPSTPAHAVRSVDSQCSAGADVFTECVITLTDTRQAGRPVLRLEPCERRGQGAGKMSYNVVTTEGIRTFENIDDAGDYAQAMSLRTGEPAKVFHAETGLVAFTVRPTTKDTK
ncbi:hypothetical protein [Bifidobacterium adolescentis]|uniref:hypothetical protein n=2 Tax=Bifidobacterium TaxID=1678 RepID=UPI00165E53F7|nr:hypothetical protein [Bifidobacterium adolescentis]MBC9857819.1 hypothetical protein [Bifidobacterium adolescentis]